MPIPIRASYDGRLRVVARQPTGTGGSASSSSIRGGGQAPNIGDGGGGRGYGYFLTYHDLEHALERRGLSMLRFILGVAGTFLCGTALMWPRIKRWGAAEGTEIALTSLQAEELKEHASSLVNTLITEEETGKNVQVALKAAVQNLMRDEELKLQMTQYMAQVMIDAMSWDNVLSSGNNYVENVLKDEASINSAHKYFSTAAQRTAEDHDVVNAASRAIWSSIKGLFVSRKPAPPSVLNIENRDQDTNIDIDIAAAPENNPPQDEADSINNSTHREDNAGSDTIKK